jgi:hypothetical protein
MDSPSLVTSVMTAAAVSAVVSALVAYALPRWMRRERSHGASPPDHEGRGNPAESWSIDKALEEEWRTLEERMLALGRAFASGAQEAIKEHLAQIGARPVPGIDTSASPRPRPTDSPGGMPRERDDESHALARDLYRRWCAEGQQPDPPQWMQIAPLRHEVIPADAATGQPGHRFHDAEQVDAFVRFSPTEDTGWMFPHPGARHMAEYVRWVFPALSGDQLASRAALAGTEPVAIVRTADYWELR